MKSLYESILDDDFEDKMDDVAQQLVRDKFKLMSMALDDEYADPVQASTVFKRALWTEAKRQDWDITGEISSKRPDFKQMEPLIKSVMYMPLLGWRQNYVSFLRNYLLSGWNIILDENHSGTKLATGAERAYIKLRGPKGQEYELYVSLVLRNKNKRP